MCVSAGWCVRDFKLVALFFCFFCLAPRTGRVGEVVIYSHSPAERARERSCGPKEVGRIGPGMGMRCVCAVLQARRMSISLLIETIESIELK